MTSFHVLSPDTGKVLRFVCRLSSEAQGDKKAVLSDGWTVGGRAPEPLSNVGIGYTREVRYVGNLV